MFPRWPTVIRPYTGNVWIAYGLVGDSNISRLVVIIGEFPAPFLSSQLGEFDNIVVSLNVAKFGSFLDEKRGFPRGKFPRALVQNCSKRTAADILRVQARQTPERLQNYHHIVGRESNRNVAIGSFFRQLNFHLSVTDIFP